jgi:hypothetical protein
VGRIAPRSMSTCSTVTPWRHGLADWRDQAACGGAGLIDRPAARGAALGGPAQSDLTRRVLLPGADRAGRGAGRGGRRGSPGPDLPPRRAHRRARPTPQNPTPPTSRGSSCGKAAARPRPPSDGMAVTRVVDSTIAMASEGSCAVPRPHTEGVRAFELAILRLKERPEATACVLP